MDTVYSLDTVYKWMTGKSRSAATRTNQPTVVANGPAIIEDGVKHSRLVETGDVESMSTDEEHNSQRQSICESNEKDTSSGTELSTLHHETDSTRQTVISQLDGGSRVGSMPPRYEDIGHNPETSQLQAGKFVHEDGHTLEPPFFPAETLRNRSKTRRKRAENMSRLREKRSSVVGLRLRLQELRVSLRRERESLIVRDAQLIQRMRVVFLRNDTPALDHLHEEFERLQEARNSLQPREDDYDKLEDQLNREEYEVGELESKLYPLTASAEVSILADDELALFDGKVESTESSLSTYSGPVETSSQVDKYLSRKGNVHGLQERLDELRLERAQIVEEEFLRAQVGRALDDYSRAFLLDFDNRHSELQRELADAEADVAKLRMALIDRDPFIISSDQFHDAPPEKGGGDSVAATAQKSLLVTDEGLSPSEYDPNEQEPLLLLGTEEPGPVFSENDIEGSKSVIGKASYINQWLLHRLRRSLHEVRRFTSTPELKNLNLDQSRLTDMVLKSWFKDGSDVIFAHARKLAAESRNLSIQTTEGLTGPRETKSESFASGLQGAIFQARNGRGPPVRRSGDASPVPAFTALFPHVPRGTLGF